MTALDEAQLALSDRGRAAQDKARILQEALPWITHWAGRTVVVKVGGSVGRGTTAETMEQGFAADVALLRSVGLRVVVVHGGGPQISHLADRLGLSSTFVDGRRGTDADMLDVVRLVLLGQVNPRLVGLVSQAGARAIGVAGTETVRRTQEFGEADPGTRAHPGRADRHPQELRRDPAPRHAPSARARKHLGQLRRGRQRLQRRSKTDHRQIGGGPRRAGVSSFGAGGSIARASSRFIGGLPRKPATKTLAPAAARSPAVWDETPPSTSMSMGRRPIISRIRRTFSTMAGMKAWPPKPGLTDITST